MPPFQLPTISSLLIEHDQCVNLKKQYVEYTADHKPSHPVARTYADVCREEQKDPLLQTIIQTSAEDLITFRKKNPNAIVYKVTEKSIHGNDSSEEEIILADPSHLLTDRFDN